MNWERSQVAIGNFFQFQYKHQTHNAPLVFSICVGEFDFGSLAPRGSVFELKFVLTDDPFLFVPIAAFGRDLGVCDYVCGWLLDTAWLAQLVPWFLFRHAQA